MGAYAALNDGKTGGKKYPFLLKQLRWAFDSVVWAVLRLNAVSDGDKFLNNNYGPVRKEVLVVDLPVEGTLPGDLDGIYLRTGPNPCFDPVGGYHWFDGDGMVHAVRLSGGTARYCNRYVETSRLQYEKEVGWAPLIKLGDMHGVLGVVALLLARLRSTLGLGGDSVHMGRGNTALVYHANRLMALEESDLPYQLRMLCSGVVETLGQCRLPGWKAPFTAHPKVDPKTGELYFFGYNVEEGGSVDTGVLDAEGRLLRQLHVPLSYPTMLHDCALTQRFLVLLQGPLEFDPKVMAEQNRLPFVWNKKLPMRVGLIPRDMADVSAVRWFELRAGFVFHTVAAWDEDDGNTVKVFACEFPKLELDLNPDEVGQAPEASVVEYTLHLDSGAVEARTVSAPGVDFPVIPPQLSAARTPFAWAAQFESWGQGTENSELVVRGLLKLRLDQAREQVVEASLQLPGGCEGGEPLFVPRKGATEADDGYLLLFVYDSARDTSEFVVYDARSMAATPLARVALPSRVPHGYHGAWVAQEQLAQQANEVLVAA